MYKWDNTILVLSLIWVILRVITWGGSINDIDGGTPIAGMIIWLVLWNMNFTFPYIGYRVSNYSN